MHEHDTSMERDLLLSRVIDGEASPEDWSRLRAMAVADASVWRDLAETQHATAELSVAVGEAIAVADTIEAPVASLARLRFQNRLRSAGTWGGWAAAAALVLAWTFGSDLRPIGDQRAQTGDMVPVQYRPPSTPDEALDQYLELGRKSGVVAGVSPQLVVQSIRPIVDGERRRFEVVYVRQIVERAEVEALRQLGRPEYDETGRQIGIHLELVRPPLGSQ